MKNIVLILLFATAGCATVRTATDFKGVKQEHGENVIATISIENYGWFLFNLVPLVCGEPRLPNNNECRLFENTVTLENNIYMLEKEMKRLGATRCINVSTHHDNSQTGFLLFFFRRLYHTSAVLIKDDLKQAEKKL